MNIVTVDKVNLLCVEMNKLCRQYQDEYEVNKEGYHWISPKVSGELRRRSMDLTRALAQLRK